MNRADFIAAIRQHAEALGARLYDLVIGQVETARASAALSAREQLLAAMTGAARDIEFEVPTCRVCGCTDDDCSSCVERTGEPCWWIAANLCSACGPNAAAARPHRRAGSKEVRVRPCPECRSRQLCEPDCSVAPWNQASKLGNNARTRRCKVCGEPGHDVRRHRGDQADGTPAAAGGEPTAVAATAGSEPADAAEPEHSKATGVAKPDQEQEDDDEPADTDDEKPPSDDDDEPQDDDDAPRARSVTAPSAPVSPAGRDRFATLETARKARLARGASR